MPTTTAERPRILPGTAIAQATAALEAGERDGAIRALIDTIDGLSRGAFLTTSLRPAVDRLRAANGEGRAG
ncbi:MAG: hypothetical protein ACK53W_13465 [Gemmatimonadota bacterium]